jgi:hypothetical protein
MHCHGGQTNPPDAIWQDIFIPRFPADTRRYCSSTGLRFVLLKLIYDTQLCEYWEKQWACCPHLSELVCHFWVWRWLAVPLTQLSAVWQGCVWLWCLWYWLTWGGGATSSVLSKSGQAGSTSKPDGWGWPALQHRWMIWRWQHCVTAYTCRYCGVEKADGCGKYQDSSVHCDKTDKRQNVVPHIKARLQTMFSCYNFQQRLFLCCGRRPVVLLTVVGHIRQWTFSSACCLWIHNVYFSSKYYYLNGTCHTKQTERILNFHWTVSTILDQNHDTWQVLIHPSVSPTP